MNRIGLYIIADLRVYSRRMRLRYFLISLLFFVCGRESSWAADPVTFNNQVVRIFQRHCQSCHRPGNIGPFSLLTYADTRHHAFQILSAVESRKMPPWKPVNSHGVFEGERGLTDAEIQTIAQWVAGGIQEGSPSDLPEPVSFPETWSAGQPDVVVQPSASFSVPAGSADIYRCFPLTIDSTSELYVRGYEILPGNRSIVHHVLLFLDTSGQSIALDNAEPGLGYTCFGGAGFINGIGGLGGWVPGASPEMFPLGTGVRVPAGARIVMQVHYSTSGAHHDAGLAGGAAAIEPDLTRIGLYLSPTALQRISFLPVVNLLFSIPPGSSRHEVRAVLPILSPVDLVSIAPHMHLLGRQISVDARLPNGETRQLIRIDDWDFHWQGNYVFREPVFLPAGTFVEMTAYYDNSVSNPRNPTNPPVTVRWGERTVDEMALTFLSVKAPGMPNLNTVPFSLTDRGTSSVLTQGSATNTQTGYARVSDTSGAAPQGLAIFGFRQNGVLISEAGVPASGLLTRGRIYAQTARGARTGVAIANPMGTPATVTFNFTEESGREVRSGTATIPANGQIAAFLDESPFNGPAPFSGSFTFSSPTPVAVVALRGITNERSEFLLTTQAVADLTASPSTAPAVFPHNAIGGGWTTGMMLVNPTDNAITGVLRFADSSGQASSDMEYSIPGKAAVQYVCCGTRPPAEVRVGTLTIIPSSGNATPAGSLVFSYRKSGVRVTEAVVPLIPAGNAFRVYVEASDAVQSGIALANTTTGSATVRFELTDLNGAAVAATTLTLAPKAQLSAFLNQISGFQNLKLPFRGLMRITSASPISVVGLRTRNNERGDFLITTTPPVPENNAASPAELFFPHFADAGGYSTQFILFSGGTGRSMKGTIRFLSPSGQPLDLRVR
jgi:hypothetical protein